MWNALASVIGRSWQEVGRQAAHVLPNLLAALFLLALGLFVGVAVGRLARLTLVAARVDRAAARIGIAEPLSRVGFSSVARLVSGLLKWTVIVVAFIPAMYALDPRVASDLAARALLYIPQLAVALMLLWVGYVLSGFLARGVLIAAVNHEMAAPRLLGAATRVGVLVVTAAIVLEHAGIGRAVVLTAFALLFGGLVLTVALAVGLGSKDIVRGWLEDRLRAGGRREQQGETFRHW